MGRKKEELFPLFRKDGFNKTYCTRAMIINTEFDFRAIFANEKMKDEEDNEFVIGEAMTIFTPTAAKEFHKDLGRAIKDYESEFGKIEQRNRNSKYSEQKIH